MSLGWPQLLVIALLILVLFGRGRISEMMGDFGKGIKSFKKGLNEEDVTSSSTPAPSQIENGKSGDNAEPKQTDSSTTSS